MIPINPKIEYEYIMQNKQFRTTRNHYMELIVCGKYMLEQGMSINDIRKLWDEMWWSIKFANELKKETYFSRYLNSIKNIKGVTCLPISIYQNEIDAINKPILPIWIKQFMFLLVGYSKTIGNSTTITKVPYSSIFRLTDAEYGREGNIDAFIHEGKKNKWVNYTMKRGKYPKLLCEILVSKNNSGEPVIVCNDIYELAQHLEVIKNQKKCKRCGALFDCSSKSRTNLCPECQVNKRRVSRGYTVPKIVQCSLCGADFEKSGRSKTALCPDCYEKSRRVAKGFIIPEVNLCSECGKQFEKSGKSRTTLCPSCQEESRKKQMGCVKPIEVTCEKCGTTFIKYGNRKTMLCEECQKIERRRKNLIAVLKYQSIHQQFNTSPTPPRQQNYNELQ